MTGKKRKIDAIDREIDVSEAIDVEDRPWCCYPVVAYENKPEKFQHEETFLMEKVYKWFDPKLKGKLNESLDSSVAVKECQ